MLANDAEQPGTESRMVAAFSQPPVGTLSLLPSGGLIATMSPASTGSMSFMRVATAEMTAGQRSTLVVCTKAALRIAF